jgi:hypothetical protein
VEKIRELVFYRHYFQNFFDSQTEKVKKKIDYVLFLVTHAEQVPEKFLKHIEGQKGLYEIRVTMKTPRDEIKMALKIMNEYFSNNNK